MRPFFKNDDFNFLTETALGSVFWQAADVGEVLTTVDRVHDGKARSWVDEWTATADRLAQRAAASAAAGRAHSAAAQYLRASLYYSLATYSADGAGDPGLFASLWEKHRAAWDRFADLGDFGRAVAERIEIPYEGTTLPGYFFRSGAAGQRRRTLVFNNGSDGSVVGAWTDGMASALARGWNAMTFDGPGQNAALVRQCLAFRPDWEKVITPVVDFLSARTDVDERKLALLGVSQGGYWVPRALAFEHRIAAAVADPGVVDVSTTVLGHLPHMMLKLLEAGDREKFDRDMEWSLKISPSTKSILALRMRPYGVSSPYDFFSAARDYALTDEQIAQITTPVLVTDPENEQFWPGQSRELFDKLTGTKAIIAFTQEEGADSHCEPAASGLRGERIFDWLGEQIPVLPEATVVAIPVGGSGGPDGADRECCDPVAEGEGVRAGVEDGSGDKAVSEFVVTDAPALISKPRMRSPPSSAMMSTSRLPSWSRRRYRRGRAGLTHRPWD
jgi:Prolyl oligopeptidase family